MLSCCGVGVERVLRVLWFRKDQKGDQGGGSKMAKIQHGVKPYI